MRDIVISGIYVDFRIFMTKFSCDYDFCKGACCWTQSDIDLVGGHLSYQEAANILYNKDELCKKCDYECAVVAKRTPVTKYNDEYYTTLLGGRCIFSSNKAGKCVLPHTPISCKMYPIIYLMEDNRQCLRIEDTFTRKWCHRGYEKGERDNVYMLDFCKSGIVDCFGDDFFNQLKKVQLEILFGIK